jgi:hypothetical protein
MPNDAMRADCNHDGPPPLRICFVWREGNAEQVEIVDYY